VQAIVDDLSAPADPQQIAVDVVTLLHHFYVSEIPQAAQDGIADHWLVELEGYPDWAIEAACRWWVSRHNAKRKKPLPGDISGRAHDIMIPVRTAALQVERYSIYGDDPPSFLKK
jgi:hypothetical protein